MSDEQETKPEETKAPEEEPEKKEAEEPKKEEEPKEEESTATFEPVVSLVLNLFALHLVNCFYFVVPLLVVCWEAAEAKIILHKYERGGGFTSGHHSALHVEPLSSEMGFWWIGVWRPFTQAVRPR